MEGGNVVNLAINLNGQPPLQTYVKPCAEPHIILRSIDLGASEVITTYEELSSYNTVGSPFSIPKAALSLAGFLPRFCKDSYRSLEEQLRAFGCGIEVTLLSAIPAGSGLGTSSLLASTVLGALSDFCGLGWDKTEIGHRTLVLEQLLTTGGGWQDQYGGLLPATDGARIRSESGCALPAWRPLSTARLPRVPPIILYRHHTHGEDDTRRDSAPYVPQRARRTAATARDEGTRTGSMPAPTRPLWKHSQNRLTTSASATNCLAQVAVAISTWWLRMLKLRHAYAAYSTRIARMTRLAS